jgi:hypothetical protein
MWKEPFMVLRHNPGIFLGAERKAEDPEAD